jgi:hypothetical protein
VGELEGPLNVVLADLQQPWRLAQRAVLVQRLVDDLPAGHPAAVTADHRLDVRLHARQQ